MCRAEYGIVREKTRYTKLLGCFVDALESLCIQGFKRSDGRVTKTQPYSMSCGEIKQAKKTCAPAQLKHTRRTQKKATRVKRPLQWCERHPVLQHEQEVPSQRAMATSVVHYESQYKRRREDSMSLHLRLEPISCVPNKHQGGNGRVNPVIFYLKLQPWSLDYVVDFAEGFTVLRWDPSRQTKQDTIGGGRTTLGGFIGRLIYRRFLPRHSSSKVSV